MNWNSAVGVVSLLMVLVGCGPSTGHVSGTVTLDGSPTGPGIIRFVPDPKNELSRDAVGNVDGEGRYVLQIAGGSREIPVGEYRVTFTLASIDESTTLPDMIPIKYQTAATSDLCATVKSGTQEYNFPLAGKRPKN